MTQIKPYKRCKKCGALIVSGSLCEDCKPMTNGDKIRAMTDEELAALIANENDFCSLCAYKSDTLCFRQPTACTHGFYEWLKQEVSEDSGTDD